MIACNDLSVIAMESQIIKTKTLPYHTNYIGYSDLGCSDKTDITTGRRKAKHTILCKSRPFLPITDHAHIGIGVVQHLHAYVSMAAKVAEQAAWLPCTYITFR